MPSKLPSDNHLRKKESILSLRRLDLLNKKSSSGEGSINLQTYTALAASNFNPHYLAMSCWLRDGTSDFNAIPKESGLLWLETPKLSTFHHRCLSEFWVHSDCRFWMSSFVFFSLCCVTITTTITQILLLSTQFRKTEIWKICQLEICLSNWFIQLKFSFIFFPLILFILHSLTPLNICPSWITVCDPLFLSALSHFYICVFWVI